MGDRRGLRVGAIPIVENERASKKGAARAVELAERILEEQAVLRPTSPWTGLDVECDQGFSGAPSLHLDDFSVGGSEHWRRDHTVLELRARLRAGDGDMVACHRPCDLAVETYLRERLGLGSPRWVGAQRASERDGRLATRCWTHQKDRTTLLGVLRDSEGLVLHPYQSYGGIWRLSHLLERSARLPVKVLGPPPALSAAVNNKVWFSRVVRRLFGERYLPPTATATCLSTATLLARKLAEESRKIVVKLPSASGGAGNLVFDSEDLGGSIGEVRGILRDALEQAGWVGETLLVSGWESHVLSAPSGQLWIPRLGQGDPIVEGVFEQIIEGRSGHFVGCRPATLEARIQQELVDCGWLLGLLFQHLGYVGRCSFDFLVVGDQHDAAKLEFLECNGRWGGTSTPMSLMNRLFGNWRGQPFCTRRVQVPGIERLRSEQILDCFERDLYDQREGDGWLIFTNLAFNGLRPWVTALGLSTRQRSSEAVEKLLSEEVPERLQELVSRS